VPRLALFLEGEADGPAALEHERVARAHAHVDAVDREGRRALDRGLVEADARRLARGEREAVSRRVVLRVEAALRSRPAVEPQVDVGESLLGLDGGPASEPERP
jgi:hypothetical protein